MLQTFRIARRVEGRMLARRVDVVVNPGDTGVMITAAFDDQDILRDDLITFAPDLCAHICFD